MRQHSEEGRTRPPLLIAVRSKAALGNSPVDCFQQTNQYKIITVLSAGGSGIRLYERSGVILIHSLTCLVLNHKLQRGNSFFRTLGHKLFFLVGKA